MGKGKKFTGKGKTFAGKGKTFTGKGKVFAGKGKTIAGEGAAWLIKLELPLGEPDAADGPAVRPCQFNERRRGGFVSCRDTTGPWERISRPTIRSSDPITFSRMRASAWSDAR